LREEKDLYKSQGERLKVIEMDIAMAYERLHRKKARGCFSFEFRL
jgi:hypothetical protein